MSVPLLTFKNLLQTQLERCENAFFFAVKLTATAQKLERRHRLEGALSDAWQAYCTFVRCLLIYSSVGAETTSGVVLAPSVTPPHWKRVSYIGLRAAKNAVVQPLGLNDILRKEPTWGEVNTLPQVIAALNPANAGTLLSWLAGGLTGPKHCQTVRNACAHKNLQTRNEVLSLAGSYTAIPITSPADAMLWRTPGQEFAFVSWLEDMRIISSGAVS